MEKPDIDNPGKLVGQEIVNMPLEFFILTKMALNTIDNIAPSAARVDIPASGETK